MASITESGRKYSSGDKRSWTRFAVLTSGLACLALGTFLIGALISHDPGDPSWNQSINRSAMNLMGLPGARVSDLLLQWIGFAAWLLPLVLIDWAVRCIGGRGLKRFWLKLAVLPPLLLAAPLAISIVPPPASWALKVGLGGVIGKLGRDGFAHINIAPPLADGGGDRRRADAALSHRPPGAGFHAARRRRQEALCPAAEPPRLRDRG